MDVILNDNKHYTPQNSKPLTTYGSLELNLLDSLGYEASNPPLGDFLRQYHQFDGRWLVACPIHWQATHNDALIVASGQELDLSEEESFRWLKEVKNFLAEENFDLHYHNANMWMLRVNDNTPQLKAKPLHLVQHQSLMPFLEEMDDTLYWQRLFTELQMFLSNHPYNEQRQGKLSINGLWIYGSGQFSINLKRTIMTDDSQLLFVFPDKIKPLKLTNPIDNRGIFLIKHVNQINLDDLTNRLSHGRVNWYWNNKAYQIAKLSWWSKLWRGRVNAN